MSDGINWDAQKRMDEDIRENEGLYKALEGLMIDETDSWEQHPDGGIICEHHGHDPARLHCVLCEIEFDLQGEDQ